MITRLLCLVFALSSFLTFSKTPAFEKKLTSEEKELVTTEFKVPTKLGDLTLQVHSQRIELPYAKRIMEVAKKDLPRLIEYFNYLPRDDIHIGLNNSAVSANGSATPFPRNFIELHLAPPLNNSHLISTEDWHRKLLVHELVHIIHLDRTDGILNVFRFLFGSFGKVFGAAVPRWFTEGVATWAEAEFTDGGRPRNPLFNLEIESLIMDDKFCKNLSCLDQPGVYPHGSTSYWLGSRFLTYLEKRKKGTIACIIEGNANSLPFFLHNAFAECGIHDANTYFHMFIELERERISRRNKKKLTSFKRLNFEDHKINWQAGVLQKGKKSIYNIAGEYRDELVIGKKFYKQDMKVEGIHDLDSEHILLSTLRPGGRNLKRYFSKVNLQTHKETPIEASTKAHYYFGSHFLSYNRDRFLLVKNHEDEDEQKTVYEFPKFFDIYHPKRKGNIIYYYAFSPKYKNKYLLGSFNLKTNKNTIHHQIRDGFSYVGECNDQMLLATRKSLYGFDTRSRKLNTYKGDNNLVQFYGSKKESFFYHKNDPTSAYKDFGSCEGSLRKLGYKKVSTKNSQNTSTKKETVLTPALANVSNYFSLLHYVPTHWFFMYYSGYNTSSLRFSTMLTDPLYRNRINLNYARYLDIEKNAGSVSYSSRYKFLTYGISYFKNYSTSSFSTSIDSTEGYSANLGMNFIKKFWSYGVSVRYGERKTRDFLSARTQKSYGIGHRLSLIPSHYDDFINTFSLSNSFGKTETEEFGDYTSQRYKLDLNFRLSNKTLLKLDGAYGKIKADDSRSGTLVGGDVSSMSTGTSMFEFYGLQYSDLYGTEISTARIQLDSQIKKFYEGGSKAFSVYYVKEIDFLMGADYAHASTIFIDNQFLNNTYLFSYHIGTRVNANLFYRMPFSIDLLYVYVPNRFGTDILGLNIYLGSSF